MAIGEAYDGTNYIGKYNRGKWGAWKNGQTYYSPFWVGYKGERMGWSHPIFQDRTQNFIHKWFPPGRQNFYNRYDFFIGGLFLQTGYYNQYTLWGNWLH